MFLITRACFTQLHSNRNDTKMAIKHLLEVSYLQITTSLEGLQTPTFAIFIIAQRACLIRLYAYITLVGLEMPDCEHCRKKRNITHQKS